MNKSERARRVILHFLTKVWDNIHSPCNVPNARVCERFTHISLTVPSILVMEKSFMHLFHTLEVSSPIKIGSKS